MLHTRKVSDLRVAATQIPLGETGIKCRWRLNSGKMLLNLPHNGSPSKLISQPNGLEKLSGGRLDSIASSGSSGERNAPLRARQRSRSYSEICSTLMRPTPRVPRESACQSLDFQENYTVLAAYLPFGSFSTFSVQLSPVTQFPTTLFVVYSVPW